jgi:hypothetical protein
VNRVQWARQVAPVNDEGKNVGRGYKRQSLNLGKTNFPGRQRIKVRKLKNGAGKLPVSRSVQTVTPIVFQNHVLALGGKRDKARYPHHRLSQIRFYLVYPYTDTHTQSPSSLPSKYLDYVRPLRINPPPLVRSTVTLPPHLSLPLPHFLSCFIIFLNYTVQDEST